MRFLSKKVQGDTIIDIDRTHQFKKTTNKKTHKKNHTPMYKPVVLTILDGWGLGKNDKNNAITQANTPTIQKLNAFYPCVALQASGISVGLPWGEMGNSEVGHITLGAGKIVYQSMPRITMDIQIGTFFKNPAFLEAMKNAKNNDSALHLMGLVGQGGVHSYIDHLYALLEMARDQKIDRVFIHLFTDGRDSSPVSGFESVHELQKRLRGYGIGKIASICGRYFAMDRNNNWDRIEKTYNLLTKGVGEQIADPAQYLQESYSQKVFDEYIKPAIVVRDGKPIATIQDGDSVIFFNFREDRARQLTKAFVLPGFMKFKKDFFKKLTFVAMTQYEESIPVIVAYPPIAIKESLGKIISDRNLPQLRIAETEKFAHVTYFFNGGEEKSFPGEDRIIVPSVTTDRFDNAPQMSADTITEKVIAAIAENKYAFILINYANADIVGHTGNQAATIQAIETIDRNLQRLIPAVLAKNGCLLITADHGNAEELKNAQTGEIDTEHSTNPVPLWFVTADNHYSAPKKERDLSVSGLLSDVAPTILDLLDVPKPQEMTGESLLSMLK